MATLNIFFYGTSEKAASTINFITQFSKACDDEPIIVDGPDVLGRKVSSIAQNVTMQIINWLKTQSDGKHDINFTGFSRGAVACIHVANNLKQTELALQSKKEHLQDIGAQLDQDEECLLSQLKQMHLNQFLLDPVAGMTDKSKMMGRKLPDNIKSSVIFLPTDEQRRDFKPQDMTRLIVDDPQTTKLSLLPLYGNHSDCTKIKNDDMQSGAKILWHSLYQFLIQHGTQFKNNTIPNIVYSKHYREADNLPEHLSAKELLQLYAEHHKERNIYWHSGNAIRLHDGMPVPRVPRTINDHLGFYVKNSHFFVNQMERELFKLSWPKTFNYLFEKNQFDLRFPNDSKSTKEEVLAELAQLKTENPFLYGRLEPRDVKDTSQGITLGQPRGFNTLEACSSVQQIAPYLIPDPVKQHSRSITRLNNLENDVYRLTFQYQRDKSFFRLGDERTESQRAQRLRAHTNYIVNNLKADETTKYNRILDELEKNYQNLSLINNHSDLTLKLRELLSRYNRNYLISEPSLSNTILTQSIQILFRLLKELVSFIGNLGHIGGMILYGIGHAIQDLGRRATGLLGSPGYNPLKYVALAITITIEGLGFALKNSFGLKAITDFLIYGITNINNSLVHAINATKIERLNEVSIPDNHKLPNNESSTATIRTLSIFRARNNKNTPEPQVELPLTPNKSPL